MKEKYKRGIEKPLTFFNGEKVKVKCIACSNIFDTSGRPKGSIFCSETCSNNFRSRISKLI